MMKSVVTVLCCLCLAAISFAGMKPVDQTVSPTQVLNAKVEMELNLRISALEQEILTAKRTGMVSQAMMDELQSLYVQRDGDRPANGNLDQGGEDCSDAFNLVSALGFNVDAGTTVGKENDFADVGDTPTCYQGTNFNGSGNGPDVTYKWTAPRTSSYTFSLCGSSYDTEISLWNYTCPTPPAYPTDYICGNDDPTAGNVCTSGSLHSVLVCIQLQQGQEVLIVVDGFGANAGNYILSIYDCNPACEDLSLNAPGVLNGTTCGAGNDCEQLNSEEVVVAVNIPYAGIWNIAYDVPGGQDAYLLVGNECCASDICVNDDGGGGLNSLCQCLELPQGTVFVTLELLGGGCADFVLTVSPCAVGRCCYVSDLGGPGCATTTETQCVTLGGVWAEGLNCQENPCQLGRCCYFDDGQVVCADGQPETFCLYQLGGQWTPELSCNTPCPALGDCGPIDLVFAVDVTGSMSGAISNVVNELPNIIAVANIASSNDLRLGLVTFSDVVTTVHGLTLNLAAVQASIAGLTALGGDGLPEASDEALREIITMDALCTDGSEFTTAFRPLARKIIVLITDASNGGCDDIHDVLVDNPYAHQRALDAAAAGIRISSVYIPNPFGEMPAVILPVLNDYAITSAGSVRIVASNGAGTGGAINQIVADCGQGELQLSYGVPDLRCDPNGGGITTPTFDVAVDVYNDGTATCTGVSVEITGVSGDGGTAVVNSANPVAVADVAPNTAEGPALFNVTITPDGDGGTIVLTAWVTSDDCPPNFVDILISVPACDDCIEEDVYLSPVFLPFCECLQICDGQIQKIFIGPLGPDQRPVSSYHGGCDIRSNTPLGCAEECPPAIVETYMDWIYLPDLQLWCMDIYAIEGGCYCFCVDRVLPVELQSFDASPGDASVNLLWRTASESDLARFDLLRDDAKIAEINATNSPIGSSYSFVDRNLENGRSYVYQLVAVDMNGFNEVLGTESETPQASAAVISEFALHQNYPNPFNPTTEISFDLPQSEFVTLSIYNLMGQKIAELVNGNLSAGRHTVTFSAENMASGVYLYEITAGTFTANKKMVLMR